MVDNFSTGMIVGVVALVTMLIRFLPFLVFRKHTPETVLYLGRVLPYAMMGMLVVYCLKDTKLKSGYHGLPELLAMASVVLLYKWKHNTLLAILGSTAIYMVLVQVVFPS